MKLDWFAARGLGGRPNNLLPSLDTDGTPLSDHECVMADVVVGEAIPKVKEVAELAGAEK